MDTQLFLAIHSFADMRPWTDALTVFLARWLPYLMVAGVIVWAVIDRRRLRAAIAIVAAAGIARGLVVPLIQMFISRQRPFEVLHFTPLISQSPGSSFPSGHATFYTALAAAVFMYDRKLGTLYLAAAMLNMLARIYAGVHWPSDVVAGALIGITCALLAVKYEKSASSRMRWRPRRAVRNSDNGVS